MSVKEEFDKLLDKVKRERDELKLKLHLGSMEARDEFKDAEAKWLQMKEKAAELADGASGASDEVMSKARIIGEELKDTYSRISQRIKKP